jgi:two-component system CheB/CheR fusion protein
MPLTGAIVLVVEDNPDDRFITRANLESLGAQVILAANGTEGLAQLDRRTPHLILCDLRMPEMDGLEFARRVRGHPRHGRARLIALTALDPWESALETWSVGFDAHLTKPVTVETLAALSRYLAPHPDRSGPARPPGRPGRSN